MTLGQGGSATRPRLDAALEPLGDAGALAAEWRRLEAEADGSFFTSWDWLGVALELMAPAPRVLRVREAGETIALALLWPEAGGRLLSLNLAPKPHFASVYPEYNGLLARRGREVEALRAALAALSRNRIAGLRISGAPAALASQAAAAGWLVSIRDRKRHFEIDLAAAREAGYLAGLSRNARQQVRRSLRAAARVGEVALRTAANADEALAWFADLERLHTTAWRDRGKAGAFSEPFFRNFNQRLIMTAFAAGGIELVRVQIGGETAGYLYNFLYRGRVLYYQSGFDYKRFATVRCGLVAHCLNIERHIDQGAAVYDFLAGEQRYKSSLARPAGEMLWFVLLRPTWQNCLTERLRRAKAWLSETDSRESVSSFVV
jgi:CelD/BcsL family acetyltransferase involved in cellulose biosynthesis